MFFLTREQEKSTIQLGKNPQWIFLNRSYESKSLKKELLLKIFNNLLSKLQCISYNIMPLPLPITMKKNIPEYVDCIFLKKHLEAYETHLLLWLYMMITCHLGNPASRSQPQDTMLWEGRGLWYGQHKPLQNFQICLTKIISKNILKHQLRYCALGIIILNLVLLHILKIRAVQYFLTTVYTLSELKLYSPILPYLHAVRGCH